MLLLLLLLVEIYKALPFQPLSFSQKVLRTTNLPPVRLGSPYFAKLYDYPCLYSFAETNISSFPSAHANLINFSLSQAKLVTPNSYLVDVNWLLSQATLWQISQCAQWLWQQEWGLGMGSTTSTLPYSGWAGYRHYQVACLPTPEALLKAGKTN